MLNAIRNLSSNYLRQSRKMAKRYFDNTAPDYNAENGALVIPLEDLKSRVIQSITNKIEENFQPTLKNGGDGLYLGTAGVSYMFYHLSSIPAFASSKEEILNNAVLYLKPAISVAYKSLRNKKDIPSFLLGNCGVYALAAAVFHSIGDEVQSKHFRELYYEAANICKEEKFLNCGSDELFVGRAGYILGALWMSETTNTPIRKDCIYDLCSVTVNSGRNYAKSHRSPCPLMFSYYQTEYLGAAHGLCSILQVLLSVPGYLESNQADAKDIKTSVDFLLSLQDKTGNFPSATDEIGQKSELVHWCHGAGGMVFLMAKAYLVWKEQKYLDSCLLMSELVWKKGLLKKGPGICHGVAGNGYVFLVLFRLTQDSKYLYRALSFAQFMEEDTFKLEARTPDNPFSLYEGLAGTACFLADLTAPQKATFPFFNVF